MNSRRECNELIKALICLGACLALVISLSGCRVREKVKEKVAYLVGMEEYVYGFPLVMMDVTREVVTATPVTGEYKAPVNQFGRIRTYVSPDFKDVVRISVNSPGRMLLSTWTLSRWSSPYQT